MPVSKAGMLIQKELSVAYDFAVLARYQNLGTCQAHGRRVGFSPREALASLGGTSLSLPYVFRIEFSRVSTGELTALNGA
jgi:hypothetical protein